MAYRLTYDYQIPTVDEPGFHRTYESREILRSMNNPQDAVSNRLFWADKAAWTIMLRPQQLEQAWLNGADQLPYIIRLADFQANPTNISTLLLIERAFMQNTNNPWIFHGPISPSSGVVWTDSPEQAPGVVNIEQHSGQSGSVVTFPTAGRFPTAGSSDMKVICWTKTALPWNMPLYLRWWVGPQAAGHQTVYDFYIGQFCLRCGPAAVEVFPDLSAGKDRSLWGRRTFGKNLFSGAALEGLSPFGDSYPGAIMEQGGEVRSLLWLPYRRNYVYLESSYGNYGVFQCHDFVQGNGAGDWAITENRNLVVSGLTPGPGYFQVQKVCFPSETAEFDLPPFQTDYAPATSPVPGWLVDSFDTPEGSTLTHTTPTATVTYSFQINTIDNQCPVVTTTPDASDQSRLFHSQYFFTAGTDPTNGALKTYTPMLYRIDVQIDNHTINWPIAATSIADFSQASPSAAIKSADFTVGIGHPGHFEALVEDQGLSLALLYPRSYFPLRFANDNGFISPAAWTTLWLGIADPMEVRERQLQTSQPREIRTAGGDYMKWLNDSPMRDNRDWTGVGHITVIQNVLAQAGIPVTSWDGPAAGGPFDTLLGGVNNQDPVLADGTDLPTGQEALRPGWRPVISPPDSYGSYIKRVAEIFAAWDWGFHADGSFYYHDYDYYSASEATFYEDSQAHPAGPLYYKSSVDFRTVECDANVVQAVAGNHGGSLQYSSLFVDFPSIKVPAAPNFIGRVKGLVFAIPGWLPCVELNKAARAVHHRARRRHQLVTVEADYVPALRVGHCFTLNGETGIYRLQSFRAAYRRPSFDRVTLEGELVELGYQ